MEKMMESRFDLPHSGTGAIEFPAAEGNNEHSNPVRRAS